MQYKYVALLRGINVGGNSKLSMTELKTAMAEAGFMEVTTYINSGNVIFSSASTDTRAMSNDIHNLIKSKFNLEVAVVVLSKDEWLDVVKSAPKWWGHDTSRKHNLLVVLPDYTVDEVMAAIGDLKLDIESAEPGKGVIYQSLSLEDFGKTTTGKLASNPIYKCITVRNYNTATKVAALLSEVEE